MRGWKSITQAAKYAHRRRVDFEELVRRGVIPAVVERGHILVHTDDIDRYYRQKALTPAQGRG